MNCKICDRPTVAIGSGTILGRHQTEFRQCTSCGFVQTDEPVWLAESYGSAITQSDLGLVKRNFVFATVCSAMIPVLFSDSARFVDYGGGYGLFVRLMRDAGFDFFRYDPFCQNLFAQGLDAELPVAPSFGLVTAFEVFEHLVAPLDDITRMLKFGRSIFFSTELVSVPAPLPEAWPYYSLEHGQHVAFFSLRTLEVVAEKFHLNLYTNRHSLHLLTERHISNWRFQTLLHRRIASLVRALVRRNSLLDRDVKSALANSQQHLGETSE